MNLPTTEHPATLKHQLFYLKIIYFFFFAAFGISTAYLNVFFYSIDLTGVQIGALSGQIMLIGMISTPLWGYLHDRIERPKLILSLLVLGAAVSALAIGITKEYRFLQVSTVFYGLFYGPIMPLVDRTNLSLLREKRELYAKQRIWGSIGFIISTLLVGNVLEMVGLRWMFPAMAFFFLLVILAVTQLPKAVNQVEEGRNGTLRSLFQTPAWLIFLVGVFVFSLANTGMNNFLGIWMHDLGGGENLIGIAFSLGAIAELPIMFFSPFLLKRLGIRNMLFLAALIFSVRLGLYAVMPSAVWALPIAILNSFTFGVFWIAAVVYVNDLAPKGLKSTSQSLLMSTMSLASVVGAPISGWLYEFKGGPVLFGALAALALFSMFWFWIGSRQAAN